MTKSTHDSAAVQAVCGLMLAVFGAFATFGADAKTLADEANALLKAKSYEAAAEKFLEAASAAKAPRRIAGGFNQALETIARKKGTNNVVTAVALAEKALAVKDLSMASITSLNQFRIAQCPKIGRRAEALAIAQDMLENKIDVIRTAKIGAEANCYGSKNGRQPWFDYLDRILRNPAYYGLEGSSLKKLIDTYAGNDSAWGGGIIDRPRLEKAEKYYEQHGFGKITPNRLAEMREMDAHFPKTEAELHIPTDLSSFGFDPNRKIVHAKDFGWNKDNATECLTKALHSDASTVIIDDMGSPWYTRPLKLEAKGASNKQIVFKKGVKLHAVTKPNFQRGDLFSLASASNIVFIGEGELGKDVYIGQFPSREARFASGQNYGGTCFGGRGYNVLVKNLWVANNLDDGFCMCGSYHYIVDCLLDNNYRQGLSVVWSDHGVYKNVTFSRTVGGEPHNGFDLEPCYETYSCPWHYFLNCKFFDNAAGNVVLSSSTFSPTTLYFKDCEFEAGRYRNFSVLARLGIYVGPQVEAPSKIILENCRLDGYEDAPVLFYNSMIFNMTFKKCTFNDKGHLDPTRKPNMSPILLNLDRVYSDGFYPKAGKVNFEDCSFNGWKDRPLIAVADHNGKVGVNTFRGTVDHNGKKVDLSKFSYLPMERSLKDAAEPELKALDVAATPSASYAPSFQFGHNAAWYHPMPQYTYLVKGAKGKKATFTFEGKGAYEAWTVRTLSPSGKEQTLGKIKNGATTFDVAFAEDGLHAVWCDYKSDGSENVPTYTLVGVRGATPAFYAQVGSGVGRRTNIHTPADKPRAVGYFEVKQGKPINIKISNGGVEFFDENGKSQIKLDDGDYFGTKCFTLNPKADAIWSFRALTTALGIRFFAPYDGIFAETPEALPTSKPGLAFAKIEPIPAPELKDEPALPLPTSIKAEVAELAAKRLAWAKEGLEAGRLADAEKSLADLKKRSDESDGIKREIDDVTRTVARFRHHANAQALAQKESEDERMMAVVCAKWGVIKAPEMMWQFKLTDGIFAYPNVRTLRGTYNEIVRRLSK